MEERETNAGRGSDLEVVRRLFPSTSKELNKYLHSLSL